MTLFKTNVKPATVRFLLLGIAFMIVVNLLSRFGIIDLTSFQSDMLTITSSIFLLSEVAFFDLIKRAKQGHGNPVSLVIAVVALVALVGAVLGFFGIQPAMLAPIKGIVDTGLLIFTVVEIFR